MSKYITQFSISDINSANFLQQHVKRALLATKIRAEWDAFFLKQDHSHTILDGCTFWCRTAMTTALAILGERSRDLAAPPRRLFEHRRRRLPRLHLIEFSNQDDILPELLSDRVSRKYDDPRLKKWDYVMFNPRRWSHMNEWQMHAMCLINYLSKYPKILMHYVNTHGNITGKTALHYAVEQGFPSIVNELLKIPGINVNKCDATGETPLHRSFMPSCPVSIPIMLIRNGADMRILDNKRFTPLNMALLFWKVDWFIPMILDYIDYDIHMKDHHGFDLLRWAVECRQPQLVEKLLKMAADPDSKDNNGQSTKNSIWARDNKCIAKLLNVEYRGVHNNI